MVQFSMIGDILIRLASWLLLAFLGGQGLIFMGLVIRRVWIDVIRPRLIPIAEIDRVADDIIANCPDPEGEAFARHERAWYNSNGAEQTYWYRVRKAVRRRLQDNRAARS